MVVAGAVVTLVVTGGSVGWTGSVGGLSRERHAVTTSNEMTMTRRTEATVGLAWRNVTDEHADPFPDDQDEETSPAPAPDGEGTPRDSAGIPWGAVLFMLAIALVVVFSVQNTDPVPVKFLWMEGEFPLATVILITIGAVVLLTALIGAAYRRRRRRRREEREELRRYRGE